jgi:hypothetical protein
MLLGSSALGQFTLGGAGYEAVSGVNYVNCAASLTSTSAIQCTVSLAGQVSIAASVTFTSSIQSNISITGGAVSYINISAVIAMLSEVTSSLTAAATFPDPGVSFTLSDKAGGA